MLAVFTLLFAAIGALALTGDPGLAMHVFSVIAFAAAAALLLICWGLLHSARVDAAGAQLDASIARTVAEQGRGTCCGHDHDVSELHTTDAGPGTTDAECEQDCGTCTLSCRSDVVS